MKKKEKKTDLFTKKKLKKVDKWEVYYGLVEPKGDMGLVFNNKALIEESIKFAKSL